MLKNQKGFSVPVLLILALLVLAIPAYYLSSANLNERKAIRGASSVGYESSQPGFGVSVLAQSETWDLVEYLCETKEECLSSLTSGRRLGTVSGGQTELHDIFVAYSNEWEDYSYVKFYVRSGWYAENRKFTITELGNIPGAEVHVLIDSGAEYEVIVAPTKDISTTFFQAASFSDNVF